MSTIILIISAILFISTFGIHSKISNTNELNNSEDIKNPIVVSIPWISGFIFPVIVWAEITKFNWIALFFINLAIVWLVGPWLTKSFLMRFASEERLGKDMLTAFIAGIVTLIIGLSIK